MYPKAHAQRGLSCAGQNQGIRDVGPNVATVRLRAFVLKASRRSSEC